MLSGPTAKEDVRGATGRATVTDNIAACSMR